MESISINNAEVEKMENRLQIIAQTLAQVTANQYVTKTVFDKSQGRAVNNFNELLTVMVQWSSQMEELFFNTCQYLDRVVEQFQFVENTYQEIFNKISN